MLDPDLVEKFRVVSRKIFKAVALPNGAVINAPEAPHQGSWADEARLVTPRVGSLVAIAADRLGLPIADDWFTWLREYPWHGLRERLLYTRYTSSGHLSPAGTLLAPDQLGWVLWALGAYVQHHPDRLAAHEPLLRRIADGLCAIWDQDHFIPSTIDFWEIQHFPAHQRQAATASLALCAAGLRAASGLIATPLWQHTAASLTKAALARPDTQPDMSLLALAWPEPLLSPTDPRFTSLREWLERECGTGTGFTRLPHDGTGTWPLLTAWLALIEGRAGNHDRAEQLLSHLLTLNPHQTLPRQHFPDYRPRLAPCAWTHAFGILALDTVTTP